MDAVTLAGMTLRVLDLQREYFTSRDGAKLKECKAAERELRTMCESLVRPTKKVVSLFDQIMQEDGG